MMLTDWELWACAKIELDRHGKEASCHAAMRSDALLAEGDWDGHRTWLRIIERIDRLTEVDADEVRH